MRKKVVIISAVSIFLIIGLLYVGVCMLSSQDDMRPDRDEGRLCYLPIISAPGDVEFIPGLRFKVDTGSDISTITTSDLAILDSLGFKVTRKTYPVIGRDGVGQLKWRFNRYTVDLPLINYDILEDSLGNKYGVGSLENVNMLRNVDFILSDTGKSVLGIDFLEKFKLEYDFTNRAIALYLTDPGTSYVTCADLYVSKSLLLMPMLGKRYSLDMKAAGYEGRFFIDSGIRDVRVKMPSSEYGIVHSSDLVADTVTNALGAFPAKVFDKALVSIGDRVGLGNVYFYDGMEEEYAINPFNLFLQNVLIDFPERNLKFYSISRTDKTIPELVSRIELID